MSPPNPPKNRNTTAFRRLERLVVEAPSPSAREAFLEQLRRQNRLYDIISGGGGALMYPSRSGLISPDSRRNKDANALPTRQLKERARGEAMADRFLETERMIGTGELPNVDPGDEHADLTSNPRVTPGTVADPSLSLRRVVRRRVMGRR